MTGSHTRIGTVVGAELHVQDSSGVARHLGVVQIDLADLKSEALARATNTRRKISPTTCGAWCACTHLAVGEHHEGATALRLEDNGEEHGVHRAEVAVPRIARDADAVQALRALTVEKKGGSAVESSQETPNPKTHLLLLLLLTEDVAVLRLADHTERHSDGQDQSKMAELTTRSFAAAH